MADSVPGFDRISSNLEYPMLVVTAAAHGERSGCLVGFSTQASLHPERFLVLLSKLNKTFRVASQAEWLAVHFLDDHNHELASLFGEETGDEEDKFLQCSWSEGPGGTLILSGVRAWLSGPVLERFDMGDHVGHLLDISAAHAEDPWRQLGFQEVRGLSPGHPA